MCKYNDFLLVVYNMCTVEALDMCLKMISFRNCTDADCFIKSQPTKQIIIQRSLLVLFME